MRASMCFTPLSSRRALPSSSIETAPVIVSETSISSVSANRVPFVAELSPDVDAFMLCNHAAPAQKMRSLISAGSAGCQERRRPAN